MPAFRTLQILPAIKPGATELLHIFISNRFGDSQPACTGKPVLGYEARVVDDEMNDVPAGTVGRLAVRGPTGCRYLDYQRQKAYVRDGWNLTGDSFWQDEDGYFHFAARSDDMIISSGYNIAGPEVEAALLAHADVAECGVIGIPDDYKGEAPKAFIKLREGAALTTEELKAFLADKLAKYEIPAAVEFRAELPKTPVGKLSKKELVAEEEAKRAAAKAAAG